MWLSNLQSILGSKKSEEKTRIGLDNMTNEQFYEMFSPKEPRLTDEEILQKKFLEINLKKTEENLRFYQTFGPQPKQEIN